MGKVKYYTPEYKKKAVEMFRNIGYHDTLEILGISDHALRLWIDQEKEGKLD